MLNRGYTKIYQRSRLTFIKNGNNFLVPIKLVAQVVFMNVSDDICMAANILKTNDKANFIVFDESGSVRGISENLFKILFVEDNQHFNPQVFHPKFLMETSHILLIFKTLIQEVKYIKKLTSQNNNDSEIIFTGKLGKFIKNINYHELFL